MAGKLSIIIPCYNIEDYIERCLNSIIPQLNDDTELIVVNDGSTDSSLDIVSKIKEKHPEILIVSQKNAGLSAARNSGAKVAKGDFFWFIDGDDYIEPNALNIILSNLDDSVDVITFNHLVKNNNGIAKVEKFKDSLTDSVGLLGIGSFYAWNRVYKSSLLKKEKFWEGLRNIEDLVFNLSASESIKKVRTLSNFLYVYERSNTNSISMNRELRHLVRLSQETLKAQIILRNKYKDVKDERLKNEWDKILTLNYAGNIFSMVRFYNCRFVRDTINRYKEWGVYPLKYNGNLKMNLFSFFVNNKSLWFLYPILKKLIPK